MIFSRPAQTGFLDVKDKLFDVVDPNVKVYSIPDIVIPGLEFVYWNGLHLVPTRDYIFDGTNITIDTEILLFAGDDIYIKYFL